MSRRGMLLSKPAKPRQFTATCSACGQTFVVYQGLWICPCRRGAL